MKHEIISYLQTKKLVRSKPRETDSLFLLDLVLEYFNKLIIHSL